MKSHCVTRHCAEALAGSRADGRLKAFATQLTSVKDSSSFGGAIDRVLLEHCCFHRDPLSKERRYAKEFSLLSTSEKM